ncbi:MAG TPA: hypothetical protein VN914_15970 [Polyangia bacterium]|nr:hypothetical protein [Polyangia bacterium]
MQLFRLILVIATTLAVVARYLQEQHRLSVVKRLPGPQARAYYERTRERSERFLAVLAVILTALAIGAVVYTVVKGR